MKVLVNAIVIVILMIGAQSAMAFSHVEYDRRDYFEGWRDAYYNWIHYGKMPEPDTHTDMYYKGFDAGWKYAREHVKLIMDHGRVITNLKYIDYTDGWLDGRAHHVFKTTQVIIRENHTINYIKGFSVGYDAPDGALPPVNH